MNATVRAEEIKVGDWIMWAGHRCQVIGRAEPLREFHQHKVTVRLDLQPENLPPVRGAVYQVNEQVETARHALVGSEADATCCCGEWKYEQTRGGADENWTSWAEHRRAR